MLASPVENIRRHLRDSKPSRFVSPTEFLSLLLSHRRLERVDDINADLRGLLDLDTGTHFVIESEKLADDSR